MNLELTRGCICNSITADNKSVFDLDDESKEKLRFELCRWLTEHESKIPTSELIEFILESCGKYECSEHACECCGDYVETYKLNIYDDFD